MACARAVCLGDDTLARRLLAQIQEDEPGFRADARRRVFARERFGAVDRLVDAIARIQ